MFRCTYINDNRDLGDEVQNCIPDTCTVAGKGKQTIEYIFSEQTEPCVCQMVRQNTAWKAPVFINKEYVSYDHCY